MLDAMESASLQALLTEAACDLDVELETKAEVHPHLPGHWLAAFLPGPGQGPLKLFAGSFEALAKADPAFDEADALKQILELAEERRQEDLDTAETLEHVKDVFAAHAAFRADLENAAGWYRRGESLGQSLWAVDLDVFLEVPLREREWKDKRGHTLSLSVQGEVFEIELPADAVFEDCWTLPGCGLYEMDVGVDLDTLEDDDEVPGRFGDLHVFPIAF